MNDIKETDHLTETSGEAKDIEQPIGQLRKEEERKKDLAIQSASNILFSSGIASLARDFERDLTGTARVTDFPEPLVSNWEESLDLPAKNFEIVDRPTYEEVFPHELKKWLECMWDVAHAESVSEATRLPGDRFRDMLQRELAEKVSNDPSVIAKCDKISARQMEAEEVDAKTLNAYYDIQRTYNFVSGRDNELREAKLFQEGANSFSGNKTDFIDAMAEAVKRAKIDPENLSDNVALEWAERIGFYDLPWEEIRPISVDDEGMHCIRNGNFGIVLFNHQDMRTGGSRIYVFPRNTDEFGEMTRQIEDEEAKDTEFKLAAFSIGLGKFGTNPQDRMFDPKFFIEGATTEDKFFRPERGIVIGGEASNGLLKRVIPNFQKMGILPQGIEVMFPDNTKD